MFPIPVPDGMPPQARHRFAVSVAVIVDMILEPISATAISFITVTTCATGSNYLLFDARELADPVFNAQKQAPKWGLAGFPSITVWLVFGTFVSALGYEISGLDRRIALPLVKFMGKRTPALSYMIVIIDILLASFTPPNIARTGDTVFPAIKNLPPLLKSFPNDPFARRIGGYLMWMMVVSTSLSSSTFITGAVPDVLGLEFVSKTTGIQIGWLQWFLRFLPVRVILLIIAPQLSYVLYKLEVTHSKEVATWAGDELKAMGALIRREWALVGLVLPNLGLRVSGSGVVNAATAGLLVTSLILAPHAVSWKDTTRYNSTWNMLANLVTLVTMANGLARSGFIDWFAGTMSAHLEGFSPNATVTVPVPVFYSAHYLFASLPAHTATMLPVTLAVGKGILDVSVGQLYILLVLSIGTMGCLTSHATSPGVTIYGCGYVKSKDYRHLDVIFGMIYIFMLPLVDWPTLATWN